MRLTAHEAMEIGWWSEVCELKGWNNWAVNEGLMRADELIELSSNEVRQIVGLPPREDEIDA